MTTNPPTVAVNPTSILIPIHLTDGGDIGDTAPAEAIETLLSLPQLPPGKNHILLIEDIDTPDAGGKIYADYADVTRKLGLDQKIHILRASELCLRTNGRSKLSEVQKAYQQHVKRAREQGVTIHEKDATYLARVHYLGGPATLATVESAMHPMDAQRLAGARQCIQGQPLGPSFTVVAGRKLTSGGVNNNCNPLAMKSGYYIPRRLSAQDLIGDVNTDPQKDLSSILIKAFDRSVKPNRPEKITDLIPLLRRLTKSYTGYKEHKGLEATC